MKNHLEILGQRTKIMKRIGYIRVSTKEQELGLEAQTQQLIDYGVAEGDIFVDKGVSGTVNSHSEVMAKLMAFVSEHPTQVEVVVSKLDRWGRDPEDTIEKIKELHKIDGCLTSLAESVLRATPDNAAGMLLIRILLAVAAMERERIAERTRDSLEALRKRGVPLGPPPKLTSRDVEWIKERHEVYGWGAQRIAKALPIERNVEVSKITVARVLGQIKGAKPYVPKDNHKYVKRAEERAAKASAASSDAVKAAA
ncbi:MAG TPA: recombinase family protein [Candidatus Microbacterium pullistercoris]|nr:recombinase family protein [Candidatus Microbacterium pullistercoris]